jgi:hypothetical protein
MNVLQRNLIVSRDASRRFFRRLFSALHIRHQNLSYDPINPDELQKKLKRGKVTFFFKKKDGTLRMAIGTTQLRFVPAEKHPKGLREPSPLVVTYFDILKKDWRSVSISEEIFIQP